MPKFPERNYTKDCLKTMRRLVYEVRENKPVSARHFVHVMDGTSRKAYAFAEKIDDQKLRDRRLLEIYELEQTLNAIAEMLGIREACQKEREARARAKEARKLARKSPTV